VRQLGGFFSLVANPRKRHTKVFLVAVVAALASAAAATADPSIDAKQSQAQQVLGQINAIDVQLGAAVEAYNSANVHLRKIQGDLRDNAFELRVARVNLKRSQTALEKRLVSIYTSGDQNSTLAVLLGSSNMDDLLNRMEAIHSTSKQDAQIVRDVTTAKREIQLHRVELQQAKTEQERVVAQRAAQRQHIESQLAERRQLLSSIRSEITHLKAQEAARQLQLAAAARDRISNPNSNPIAVGPGSPEGSTVAPPSIHGGVVGIAMRYLGVPYVWGGASPSGFDCSGLVMYVFAQIGVSLPHSSYAQYGMGASVSMSQLQPGDLVFFAGASHVGIYIGGGQFIHAPHTGDVVKISSLTGWYASTFAGGRRI
jgi:cell wall-associated NlpC family hydrolase